MQPTLWGLFTDWLYFTKEWIHRRILARHGVSDWDWQLIAPITRSRIDTLYWTECRGNWLTISARTATSLGFTFAFLTLVALLISLVDAFWNGWAGGAPGTITSVLAFLAVAFFATGLLLRHLFLEEYRFSDATDQWVRLLRDDDADRARAQLLRERFDYLSRPGDAMHALGVLEPEVSEVGMRPVEVIRDDEFVTLILSADRERTLRVCCPTPWRIGKALTRWSQQIEKYTESNTHSAFALKALLSRFRESNWDGYGSYGDVYDRLRMYATDLPFEERPIVHVRGTLSELAPEEHCAYATQIGIDEAGDEAGPSPIERTYDFWPSGYLANLSSRMLQALGHPAPAAQLVSFQ